jgi:hypothetical protein
VPVPPDVGAPPARPILFLRGFKRLLANVPVVLGTKRSFDDWLEAKQKGCWGTMNEDRIAISRGIALMLRVRRPGSWQAVRCNSLGFFQYQAW